MLKSFRVWTDEVSDERFARVRQASTFSGKGPTRGVRTLAPMRSGVGAPCGPSPKFI